jgi:hypothetical protein
MDGAAATGEIAMITTNDIPVAELLSTLETYLNTASLEHYMQRIPHDPEANVVTMYVAYCILRKSYA